MVFCVGESSAWVPSVLLGAFISLVGSVEIDWVVPICIRNSVDVVVGIRNWRVVEL